MSKNRYISLDLATFLLLAAVFSHSAAAVPLQGPVDWLIDVMTGALARSCAVLAVVVCGYAAWVGKLAWGLAFRIIAGVVLIFGGVSIADLLIGEVG